MSEDTGRITVSKDFLRAELGGLELRLVDKLAAKAEVEALEHRVDALETDVDRLRSWRRALTAGVAMFGAVSLALLPETLRHYLGG